MFKLNADDDVNETKKIRTLGELILILTVRVVPALLLFSFIRLNKEGYDMLLNY